MCRFLTELGVSIDGVSTSTLAVHGVSEICKETATYALTKDPIEAMAFIAAAVSTNSKVTVRRVSTEFLEVELLKLEIMRVQYDRSTVYKAENEHADLVDVTIHQRCNLMFALPDKIHPGVLSGLNIDNLPLFVLIAAMAFGTTMIHEWVFEGRATMYSHFSDLGVDITVLDPHRVQIAGSAMINL